ncbi:Integrase catalytic domain-containing protein [Citrus sinensis]|nr:Integrase catalytic domain-containing protein [Citrus sinensis]
MYTRFTDIVNTLGALGKNFFSSEKVKKIFSSLSKEWRPKRTAIEEAKNLNTLPIDDLISSLISYEEDLTAEKRHEEKKKSITLKALKHESDEESELDDEEMAMLIRRFRKFYKKTSERRKFRNFKNQKEKKESITCYKCKKPGHIRSECPLLNKLKKKAMVATWDNSDEEMSGDEEHQEMTNLALMAIEEESLDGVDKVSDLSTYDELHDAFKELHDEWIKIGIVHQFSSPRTPQQNEVVERKNKLIQEMARIMLNENSLLEYFWAGAVNTASYVLNRVLIRSYLNKIPYELWKDRKPNIGYFKVFGCKCFILNTKDNIGKFDTKSDVGIFLGYSNSSKVYRVYNKRTLVVEESMHVAFDESNPSFAEKVVVDNDAYEELQEESPNDKQKDALHGNEEEQHEETNAEQNVGTSQSLPKEWRYVSSHPKDLILRDPSHGITTRSSFRNTCEHAAFISQIKSKSFADVENNESWIITM